jgi:hypothetical protein
MKGKENKNLFKNYEKLIFLEIFKNFEKIFY